MHRTILHVDMNAFFASVEQQDNPELRGKPVAVAGSGERTVITTASYEARAFGVRTGMTVRQGWEKCPELVVVVGNHRRYAAVSREIFDIFSDFTPLVETFSIDEGFLDITASTRLLGPPEKIALDIKDRIRARFGLTCSVGIAPNKLLAKLASEMKKPDGLTVIAGPDIPALLRDVKVTDLCGVGKRTAQVLLHYGIRSCGDLQHFPEDLLRQRLGVGGPRLKAMAMGIDDSPVVPASESADAKSIGHSTTLPRDISRRDEIVRELLRLSEMVSSRARRHSVTGRTVGLSIRYADFDTSESRQTTLSTEISATRDIHATAVSLLDSAELAQPVRLLGVRLTNLRHSGSQMSLFQEDRKALLAGSVKDSINTRFGQGTITLGSLVDQCESSPVIPPSWRPSGLRTTHDS